MFNNRSELFPQRSISLFSGPFFSLPFEIPMYQSCLLGPLFGFFFFLCVLFCPVLETPINGRTPYSRRIFIIPIKYLYP